MDGEGVVVNEDIRHYTPAAYPAEGEKRRQRQSTFCLLCLPGRARPTEEFCPIRPPLERHLLVLKPPFVPLSNQGITRWGVVKKQI